ncbi:MAG: hypothetical protein HRT90_02675 [Candidatus Margulisbacteria bacterium]|nr:hypothetical protein [Candidatus Margulisiibacteriota bacterium]
MPTLRYEKNKSNTYVYIVENRMVINPDTQTRKQKRIQLEKLGILGKDISKSQAKIVLARYMDLKQPLTTDITVNALIDEYKVYYKTQIGNTIAEGTYKLFCFHIMNMTPILHINLRKLNFQDIETLKSSVIPRLSNRSVNIMLVQVRKMRMHPKQHPTRGSRRRPGGGQKGQQNRSFR